MAFLRGKLDFLFLLLVVLSFLSLWGQKSQGSPETRRAVLEDPPQQDPSSFTSKEDLLDSSPTNVNRSESAVEERVALENSPAHDTSALGEEVDGKTRAQLEPKESSPESTAENHSSNKTEAEESVDEDSEIRIKVPYPVFVASLYKSGTTTIHSYFQCGGQRSVHYANGRTRTGPCLQRRIQKGLHPVFEGCGGGEFDIYTDNANLNAPRSCFDPSVHGLEQIYQSYPNGTILMAVRDTDKWLDSVERYKFRNWELLTHLKQCPDLWLTQKRDIGSNRTLNDDDIKFFYDWHTKHVRDFAASHPSMTYVEVKLEDTNTANILEEKVGIPASCWGHSNINTRHVSTKDKEKQKR